MSAAAAQRHGLRCGGSARKGSRAQPARRAAPRAAAAETFSTFGDSNKAVGKRTDLKTIMVLGAGPIVIGQACEFDYSGTQACKALKAEGYRVVLINSNPATIMTDPETADRTYVTPMTPDLVEKVRTRARGEGGGAEAAERGARPLEREVSAKPVGEK